jgi:anti-anti-sigma regulatory factor/HAMP domain-containing protein
MRTTLSSKVIVSVAALLVMLSTIVAALTYAQVRRATINEQAKVMDVLNYTFEILLSQDALPSLQRLTENSATIEGVRSVAIIDRGKKALASSLRSEVGSEVSSPLVHAYLKRASWERVTHETDSELILLQPLRGSHSSGGAAGDIVGVARVTMDLATVEHAARTAALRLVLVSLGSYIVLFVLLAFMLRALVTGPVQRLATVARQFRLGDRSLRSLLRGGDEIGLLSSTFDEMADEVDALLKGLEDQVSSRTAALESERTALEKALEELKAGTAARLALAETVRKLSTPVIRLYDRILVMPLVGTIDADRAQQIERSLLEGISVNKAEEVILDLTGVPLVDMDVAASLMRATGAAQMLGARVTLVGIGPDVAQSIVSLGIRFPSIATRADLQRGLIVALRRLGLSVGGRR